MATGLGSPLGGNLASTLCHMRAPVYSVGVANPGTRTSPYKVKLKLQLKGSDSGRAPLFYSAAGLPAGLTLNGATGLISGAPTKVKTYKVTVLAGDGFANRGSTSFKWAIVKPGPPVLAHPSLKGLSKGKVKLSFSVGEGKHAHAIHGILLKLPKGLTFTGSKKTLAKHILVRGSTHRKVKFTAKVKHGLLTITLSKSQKKATFTIGYPAIHASKTLASKAKHHKVHSLTFSLKAVDSVHKSTKVKLKPKA
jgi:Putative Ig domain.